MNSILSEKEYQTYILERLKENGYEIWQAKEYDRLYAINRRELFRFLYATQPDEMKRLNKIYKSETEDTIVACINSEETKQGGSRLHVLKHGIEISHIHLDLMYTKPATSFNADLNKKYGQNIFSASEEVWASNYERIDVVIFLNGLALMTFELKCNAAGQSYQDAIRQYRKDRNPKTRLFRWKAGVLVMFAMDLERVYMTTKLDETSTYFLPFNQGSAEGIYAGAGNPIYEDKYSVSYMWENILQKDSVLEILDKFMFIELEEKKNADTGKVTKKETVIFPRYHQLDVIRKLLESVKETHTSQNYLLQHSAGSGKTNEIAWLSHRLASLHDDENQNIFSNIIICTDRVVVDRQLQKAILGIEHKAGLIRVMDEKCNSRDLANALQGNTKIIATTIQKFPYILDSVSGLQDKTFAVIIDEAHSSTAGKNMAAVTKALGSGEENIEGDVEDIIAEQLEKSGKQKNVAMFAFTATPKPTTLQLFGRRNTRGKFEAFHIYSMKQAIEEEFILDVLQNYITYDTYYHLNKEIEEDPTVKTGKAKRQIARFIALHETNIAQRIEVIIEHFRTTVMDKLGGQAKAMVITPSREAAVKYRQAFEKYTQRKGYSRIKALVAFSGKVTIDGETYTEAGMNGFSEKNLPDEFDKKEYQVLLVADKYQTGFDQKKLCAMYVLKKLKGVAAVQTLSRLNRICPPYDKKTFVLDFVNNYEDMEMAFSRYYTTTMLAHSINEDSIYDLMEKIEGYYFLDPSDVDSFCEILYSGDMNSKAKMKLTYLLQKAHHTIESNDELKQKEIAKAVRHFVRCYEFFLQVTCFDDEELHKKYLFLSHLQAYLKKYGPGGGFDITGKIKAMGFVQKKIGEHKNPLHQSDPEVKLPVAEQFHLKPEKEKRLSEIIEEINSKTGKSYDNNVAVHAMMQVKDILAKSPDLKTSARNNTVNEFEFAYYDSIDDALIEGLNQNEDFFTLLLQNEEIKKEVMGIFTEEIYNSFRTQEVANA